MDTIVINFTEISINTRHEGACAQQEDLLQFPVWIAPVGAGASAETLSSGLINLMPEKR